MNYEHVPSVAIVHQHPAVRGAIPAKTRVTSCRCNSRLWRLLPDFYHERRSGGGKREDRPGLLAVPPARTPRSLLAPADQRTVADNPAFFPVTPHLSADINLSVYKTDYSSNKHGPCIKGRRSHTRVDYQAKNTNPTDAIIPGNTNFTRV